MGARDSRLKCRCGHDRFTIDRLEGRLMILTLEKQTESINDNGFPVMLWKFIDENGNIWNTETAIDETEDEAKQIILHSIANNG
jgi:hypothetical protein